MSWSYPHERHDPAIEVAVFLYASLRRCLRIYSTAPGFIVCTILSIRMLQKSQDRQSLYLKPRLAVKGSVRLLPTFMTHWAFSNVISQSLISFAAMPNSYLVTYRWSLCGVSKVDLKSTKRWNVLICISRVFSKIWRSIKIWSMVDLPGSKPHW